MTMSIRMAGRGVLVSAAMAGLACLGVAAPATASSRTVPRIHSFLPARGAAGTQVTITGAGFARVRAVRFTGVAAKFKVQSASRITAVVPAMPAGAGLITVTTRSGTVKSRTRFRVIPGIVLSPPTGPPGSVVRVSGTGFGARERVSIFAGTTKEALASTGRAGSFGRFRVTVPASAVPGTVWISAKGRRTRLSARVAFTVSTDWAQFRFSADHTGSNPHENVLSKSDVAGLRLDWSFHTGSFFPSPSVAGGVVYAASNQGDVYALNAVTGVKRWAFHAGASFGCSPAVAGGTVYVNSYIGNGVGAGFGVVALSAATGAKRWIFNTDGAFENSSPVVAGGAVYTGSDDDHVYALNAATGAKLWTFATGGAVDSSPAVAGGVVYIGSDDDNVYALNAATGTKLWTFSTGGAVDSSPAVAGAVVYIGSRDHNMYALNAATGTKRWNFTTGGAVSSSPAVANGVVYIGSGDANVYALNAATGAKLWNFTTLGAIHSSPAVVNGMVYIGSGDVHVYAFGLPGVRGQRGR